MNGAGGDYGSSAYACDGEWLLEVSTGEHGGYVVRWNAVNNLPESTDIDHIQRFKAMESKVEAILSAKPDDSSHASDCASRQHTASECTCGLADRLAAQESEAAQ